MQILNFVHACLSSFATMNNLVFAILDRPAVIWRLFWFSNGIFIKN